VASLTPRPDAAALPTTFPTPSGAVTAARAATRRTSSVPSQRARGARSAPQPQPLGSLVTAPPATSPHTSSCAHCGATVLTEVRLTLTDGSPVTFVSCHACERTGWFAADGDALGLDAVLALAARR
jgi:hypothetical protein